MSFKSTSVYGGANSDGSRQRTFMLPEEQWQLLFSTIERTMEK